jgi:hypothetical protein
MFFLMGERVIRKLLPAGTRHCAVCRGQQEFQQASEINYFTLFTIPLLQLGKVADYLVCSRCESSYVDFDAELPAQVPLVRLVTAYILNGYGMQNQVRIIQEIGSKVSGFDFATEDIRQVERQLESDDVLEVLSAAAPGLNDRGKLKVIEAAFLGTHVCCEIQYEDRLRINLMGNALGVSLQFVEYAVEEVRRQKYYGVHRLLPTQPMTE